MVESTSLRRCRIVYVGDLSAGATGAMRMVALRSLGFDVVAIDSSIGRVTPLSHPFLYASIKIHRPLDPTGVNRQILSRLNDCDILWIDKGVSIWPSTLKAVRTRSPRVRIIGYSPDDMLNPKMSSSYFTATLPLYDSFFTTKSYGVAELKALGCRQVVFIENAYDPQAHRPIIPAETHQLFACNVGFIGTYERDRADMIERLARSGIPVVVRGNRWGRVKARGIGGITVLPEAIGDDYCRAIGSTRINLAFLCKANRDLQTTRSIEIPACQGFMLAERTAEHQSLFSEGREADYFQGFDELTVKIKKYLADEPLRQEIAAAGRSRCIRDDYTYAGRFRRLLHRINTPLPSPTDSAASPLLPADSVSR